MASLYVKGRFIVEELPFISRLKVLINTHYTKCPQVQVIIILLNSEYVVKVIENAIHK